jgi:acetyl esterase
MSTQKSAHQKGRHIKNYLVRVGLGFLALVIVTAISFRLSPWPGVLVIRHVFDQGSHKTLVNLEKAVPPQRVTVISDQSYDTSPQNKLDVYTPDDTAQHGGTLPTVLWTHGGAWLSGDKTNAAPYFKLLASQGFTVVSINYTLAPSAAYPTQIKQLNQAHRYLLRNADRLHIDSSRLFLAGDSAGAQLSSQLAALITDPAYAQTVGIQTAIQSKQLRGVLLFCGIYKMEGLATPDPTLPKIVSWGDDVSVWAYAGTRDRTDPVIRQMSAYYHVSKAYPATFITGGNADPLTNAQSKPFAQKLQQLGVDTTTRFYPKNHTPALPHEYQFTLNNDGKQTLSQAVQFVKQKAP